MGAIGKLLGKIVNWWTGVVFTVLVVVSPVFIDKEYNSMKEWLCQWDIIIICAPEPDQSKSLPINPPPKSSPSKKSGELEKMGNDCQRAKGEMILEKCQFLLNSQWKYDENIMSKDQMDKLIGMATNRIGQQKRQNRIDACEKASKEDYNTVIEECEDLANKGVKKAKNVIRNKQKERRREAERQLTQKNRGVAVSCKHKDIKVMYCVDTDGYYNFFFYSDLTLYIPL